MKFLWWRKGKNKLTITGRRLDAPAPPLRAEVGQSGDIHMVPTYIIFSHRRVLGGYGESGEYQLGFRYPRGQCRKRPMTKAFWKSFFLASLHRLQ